MGDKSYAVLVTSLAAPQLLQERKSHMRYVEIDAGKKISKIGLGTWQFGSPEWDYGERYVQEEVRSIVRRAIELGVTLFDTAEIYGVEARSLACRALVRGVALSDVSKIQGFGRGEQILGEALDGSQESAFLATKLYPAVPAGTRVRRRAAASAARLGTSRLDLYQVHQPPAWPAPTRSCAACVLCSRPDWSAKSASAMAHSADGARPKPRWAAGY